MCTGPPARRPAPAGGCGSYGSGGSAPRGRGRRPVAEAYLRVGVADFCPAGRRPRRPAARGTSQKPQLHSELGLSGFKSQPGSPAELRWNPPNAQAPGPLELARSAETVEKLVRKGEYSSS